MENKIQDERDGRICLVHFFYPFDACIVPGTSHRSTNGNFELETTKYGYLIALEILCICTFNPKGY